jgi:hypothetical protein
LVRLGEKDWDRGFAVGVGFGAVDAGSFLRRAKYRDLSTSQRTMRLSAASVEMTFPYLCRMQRHSGLRMTLLLKEIVF